MSAFDLMLVRAGWRDWAGVTVQLASNCLYVYPCAAADTG
jgi:hypothetical protein